MAFLEHGSLNMDMDFFKLLRNDICVLHFDGVHLKDLKTLQIFCANGAKWVNLSTHVPKTVNYRESALSPPSSSVLKLIYPVKSSLEILLLHSHRKWAPVFFPTYMISFRIQSNTEIQRVWNGFQLSTNPPPPLHNIPTLTPQNLRTEL